MCCGRLRKVVGYLIVVVLLAACCFEEALAAGPSLHWQKTFGGSARDWGGEAQQTSDGGYIIAGQTDSFGAGGTDVYIVKTDPAGNMQWGKTYGGGSDDEGWSVRETADGGYIVGGFTSSYGAGSDDAYLIKTDSAGNVQWEKTYGGGGSDQYFCVRQTLDGGYVMAGATNSYGAGGRDIHLIRTGPDGNMQWHQTYGGSRDDGTGRVAQTSDGGYIIGGYTTSFGAGGYDVYLIKTDPNGSAEWTKTFGGWADDLGLSACQTADGGYIVVGYAWSYGAGLSDVYVIKTDSAGNAQWEKTFGGTGAEIGWYVEQTNDGGYIIAGGTDYNWQVPNVFDPTGNVYLLKIDSGGNLQWETEIGGSYGEQTVCVQQTSEGGYVASGWTKSYGSGSADIYVIRLGPDLAGDLDLDGDVDLVDYSLFAPSWDADSTDGYWDPGCDLSNPADNTIDMRDLAVLMENWLVDNNP